MKKIILSIFCCLTVLFTITGCGEKWYRENIDETYRDYWNYSLGNYEVSYKVNDDNGSNGSGGFITNKWYDYTFTFKDIDNNSRNITISNYNIKDFNDEIANAAGLFLKEDIENIFKNQNFTEVSGIQPVYNLFFCYVNMINKNIDLYDDKAGLKFNELNLNTLSKNNINVIFKTQIQLDGYISDYPNLKQKIIDDVKFIFEHYEYLNIKFEFEIVELPDIYKTRTIYYLSYDGTNYNWEEGVN